MTSHTPETARGALLDVWARQSCMTPASWPSTLQTLRDNGYDTRVELGLPKLLALAVSVR